jgi:hypothetical protein
MARRLSLVGMLILAALLLVLPAVASDDDVSPASPEPSSTAGSVALPGATYLGQTATGAPVKIVVAADAASVERYEFGSAETAVHGPAVVVWGQPCSSASRLGYALTMSTGRAIPIGDGRFATSQGSRKIEGVFSGETVSGTFRVTIVPDDLACDVATDWTARVAP